MKKLTSKKGFTLIEMLVVISIIAILVAIIVPTVSTATAKAKFATDAANLRSAVAECEVKALEKDYLATKTTPYTFVSGTDYTAFTPKSDKYGSTTVTIQMDANGKVTGTIGKYDATDIGKAAESGSLTEKK